MTYYQRNLPHWHPAGVPVFLTWRLNDSLPASVFSRRTASTKPTTGEQFLVIDRHLDRARTGPTWLKDHRVAACVTDAIKRGENPLGQYDLQAFVVMANHAHILIVAKVPLARITNGIKGVAARDANRILVRIGKRFWQDESFDHWVRNASEFERIKNYIEMNPVRAGLAKKPGDWQWSSAADG
jgi:putative transposase